MDKDKSLMLALLKSQHSSLITFSLLHKKEYNPIWRYKIHIPEEINQSIIHRQNEYICGRMCAANALVELGSHQYDVGRGESGNPQWPSGIIGSISHNDHWVISCCAWRKDIVSIGIDIEECIHFNYFDALANYVFFPEELSLLRKIGIDELTGSTILFSVKEATFKFLSSLNIQVNIFKDIKLIEILDSKLILELIHTHPPNNYRYIVGDFLLYKNHIITVVKSQF